MSRGREWRAAALAVAGALGTPRTPAAQLSATLDAGFARVEYDGFLPSGAVSLTPAIRWDHPSWSVALRGTVLRFESGNFSRQGLAAGTMYTPPYGSLRGEVSATAGASSYRRFPSFGHLLGRARVHLLTADRGGWIATGGGQTSLGASVRPVTTFASGVWTRRWWLSLDLSATHTRVGDTAFTDLETGARWTRSGGAVEIQGSLGARLWSRGGGHGVYGEANASVALSHQLVLILGAGRYPTDPTRGSVAGRYLSAGLRVTGLTAPPPPRTRQAPATQMFRRADDPGESAALGSDGHFAAATLELQPQERGGEGTTAACRILIRAAWAQTVEIMGDFTDWQAVPLSRKSGGVWEITLPLSPGVHRLNVRLDFGEWVVPRGAAMSEDEFGGRVGTIVVT